ncbi:hypothetical protein [Peribacillus kribbensis]|uniref:hypothetical protein n=1 Tax=Peribacillus kribbensis TaxID=356658 RepID=UPI00041E2CC3|nr:hypothetical protein [Peribacillus kribbensis]
MKRNRDLSSPAHSAYSEVAFVDPKKEDQSSPCKILPFRNRPSQFDKIKNILRQASDYKIGPIFIKGNRIWVICYGSIEWMNREQLEEETERIAFLLERKLANFKICVRLEEEGYVFQ